MKTLHILWLNLKKIPNFKCKPFSRKINFWAESFRFYLNCSELLLKNPWKNQESQGSTYDFNKTFLNIQILQILNFSNFSSYWIFQIFIFLFIKFSKFSNFEIFETLKFWNF